MLEKRINFFCNKDYDREGRPTPGTLLVFGAPGIGKSTIPREVVMEYNKNKERKDKIALITVSCANINPGEELLMPSIPIKREVSDYIEKHNNIDEIFPDITPDKKEILMNKLKQSQQQVATEAPKHWLPCYLPRPYEENKLYADMVNCNVMEESDEFSADATFTGSGGIILFDDFLRAKPSVVHNLTYFSLERKINGWRLGSKWTIIACTNRPCDDDVTADTFGNFSMTDRDRWAAKIHLDPDPEQWKEWARKKGFDETLLKFIFDKSPDSLINGEYTRWHRVVHKDYANTDSHKPVTPREWMIANNELLNFMQEHKNEDRFKDGFSISKMTPDEVVDTINIFDDDFLEELKQWLETNCNNVDLEKILKDPEGTPMPMTYDGFGNIKVIESLFEQIKSKYGKNGKEEITDEITDDDLSNIMIWMGQNLQGDFNNVFNEFLNRFDEIFLDEENNNEEKKSNIKHFWDYHKFGVLCLAAFPEYDYIKTITYKPLLEALCNENHGKSEFHLENPDPIELHEKVKSFANEYFPWRLKDGKLDLISKKETITLGKEDIDENPEDYVVDPEVIKKISEDIVEN